ncbi:CapA family protein [Bradyrhizobium sp. CCGUVB14]|uniref:CapA family protein n=1 Tax=Bradyrhizobium sp. CCGUVB14 TaxID=2949628 RepID=UPI0020B2E2DF|nr:CapA family protein [Bradyrhizobium sp. CCGUVB14]MCP3441085.1 CapA family protein [Bradyrhizobium sp. CCGUVB14]
MTAADWGYWLYKLARPTTRAEKNVPESLFAREKTVVKLPHGFESQAVVTLGAAGDLMPLDDLEASKDILFDRVADVLFNVDISLANLEAPLTEQKITKCLIPGQGPKNPIIMRNSIAHFSVLASHRGKYFTALNFANNHAFDLGIEGVETTRRILNKNGVVTVGAPATPDEYGRAAILSKGKIKIGFVSATFGLNGRQPPKSEAYRVHAAKLMSKEVATDLGLLKIQIEDCKKHGCDFIVASMHWGYEFEFFPRARQIEIAHRLVEGGVDLIWGHHPHVIQPIEYYRTKRDSNRIAAIAYSLGGLTFGWDAAPHLMLGLILNVKLVKGSIDGDHRTYIESIKPIPVFQDDFRQDGKRKLRIERLADHLSPVDDNEPDDRRRHIELIKQYADLVLMNSFS